MNLNKAEIIGFLSADPKTATLPSGQSLARFRVATNHTWRDTKSKELQRSVEFHSAIAWGKLADVVGKYLKKGDRVYLDGRLHTRQWDGKDGQKRQATEIVTQNLIMLGGSKAKADGTAAKANDEVVVEEINVDKVNVDDKE